MRQTAKLIFLCLVVFATTPLASADELADKQHPLDAALYKTAEGEWTYVSFPAGSRLYVYDGDSPGQSSCVGGCVSAWPPLYVSEDSTRDSIGDWSVIRRADGRAQWAYKGRPVYRRFHDLPGEPGEVGGHAFHRLQP